MVIHNGYLALERKLTKVNKVVYSRLKAIYIETFKEVKNNCGKDIISFINASTYEYGKELRRV